MEHFDHTVDNVSEHQAVCAFKGGMRYRELNLKFGRTGDMSLSQMMEIASRYANGEEADRLRSGKKPVGQDDQNSNRKPKRKAEPAAQGEAAVVKQGKGKGKPKGPWVPKKVKDQAGNDVLDLPCPIHTKKDEEGNLVFPKHTSRQCRLLIQNLQKDQSTEKGKESEVYEGKEGDGGYP